jgi:ion channel-forming bestrophin family protein
VIVRHNLRPWQIVRYTAGPMGWALAWSVGVTVLYAATDDERLVLPFAPVAAFGSALAIFVAFRNNTAFARWNEARGAWQQVLVASRILARQVLAAADDGAAAGRVDAATASGFAREVVRRFVAHAHLLAARVRNDGHGDHRARAIRFVTDDDRRAIDGAVNPPSVLLTRQAVALKAGIRAGVLGQFDPIAIEPQLAVLQNAQGTVERIHATPTPRQYEYFTRRFVQLFAALVPFATIGLVPDRLGWAVPISLILSGVFVMMAVTGSANDEPFAGAVTDVPVTAVCTELERDLLELLGDADLPPVAVPVDGFLW